MKRRRYRCKACDELGHNRAGCPKGRIENAPIFDREQYWDEIGARLNMSRESVRQIALGALAKLRTLFAGDVFALELLDQLEERRELRSPMQQLIDLAPDDDDVAGGRLEHFGLHA